MTVPGGATEIASLVVGIGGDPSGYTRALRDSADATRRFTTDFKQQFAAIDLPVSQIAQKGNLIGFRLYDALRDSFEASSRANQEALARGLIDRREFERRGREAAAALNTGILTGIDQLRTAGALSAELEHELIRQLDPAGVAAGTTLLTALERTFDQRKRQLAEALARGVISPTEFRQQGADAAREFNAGLLAEIDRARASVASLAGPLAGTGPFRDARGRFATRPAASAALADAQRTAAAIERTYVDALKPVSAAAVRAGDNLSAMGRRAAPAITGVAFAFEGWSRSAAAGEAATRGALRQVANFAFFFGPEGAIVAGVAAAGLATYEYFDQTREKARQATDQVANFQRALLFGSKQELLARVADLTKPILDAEAEIKRLEREAPTITTHGGQFGQGVVTTINPALIQAREHLAALRKDAEALTRAVLFREGQEGFAGRIERATKAQREFLDQLRRAQDLLALEPTVQNLNRVAELYDEAGRRADRITNATDEHRLALLRVREEMERIAALRAVAGLPFLPDLLTAATGITPVTQTAPHVGTRTVLGTGPSDDPMAQLLANTTKALERDTARINALRDLEAERLRTLFDVEQERAEALSVGITGTLQLATAIGALDTEATRAVSGVLSLVGSIEQIRQGGAINQVAGAFGVAGAVAGILAPLFSSESESARAERENTQALIRMTQSLEGNALGRFLTLRDVVGEAAGGGGGFFNNLAELQIAAAAAGLTLGEVKAAAAELGIDITQLTTEQLRQFEEMLELTIEGLTRWQETLDHAQQAQDLRNQVFDVELTPLTRLSQSLDLLEQFAPGLADRFAGIDASTAAGRAEIEAAMRQLAEDFLANLIPPELMGEFGREGLIDWLLGADSALDDFTEGLRDATGALLNIPTGFRMAAAIFGAQLPELPPTTPPAGVPAPWNPPTQAPHPTGPSGIPASSSGGGSGGDGGDGRGRTGRRDFVFAAGAIVINARDRSVPELFDEIEAEAFRRALAPTGDTSAIINRDVR